MINKRRRYGERAAVMLVIFTVSITIVIVSLIGAFFFGSGCVDVKGKDVSANGNYYGDKFTCTYLGGPDQDSVTNLSGAVNIHTGSTSARNSSDALSSSSHHIGATVSAAYVNVVATFSDGTEQEIMNYTLVG
jgi:hypothetical protein